jgi:TonB family protein
MKKSIVIGAILASFAVIHAQESPADLIKSAEQAVRKADYATADQFYAKAASGADRAEIAPALLYLGVRALGTGNRLAAEGMFQRVLQIDAKGPQAGPALSWLASMRAKQDPAASEQLFKQALSVEDPTSSDYVDTLRKYSLLVRKLGRSDEAQDLETRAREVQTGRPRLPARELSANVYKVGGGVTAPALVFKREPEYTEGARAGAIQGTTILSVDIGPDGIARNFQVERSLEPSLDQKAIEAVQQWQFRPGAKDGQPVTVRATIEVNFRLM